MFDVGFGEMIVIALIALIVLGPERLPKLARWIGRFTGQARAYMQGLSAELERESHLAELKRQLAETERLAREHADTINRTVMSTHQEVSGALAAPVMTALPAPAATPAPILVPALAPPLAVPDEVGLVNAVPAPVAIPTPELELAPSPAAPRVPLGRQPDLWLAEQAQAETHAQAEAGTHTPPGAGAGPAP